MKANIKLIALGIKFSHILFVFLIGTKYLAYPERPRPQQRDLLVRMQSVLSSLQPDFFYQKRKIVLKGNGKYP